VLFGPENLAGLDCDTEERVAEFLELNPQASETLQTRGARGRTFHFRIRGNYPKLLCKLKTGDGQKIGEWRGANGYTVVSGIHPDTGEPYKILIEKPPLLIDWNKIIWPPHWNVPWQPKTAETATSGTSDGNLSRRILTYQAGCPPAISGNGGHIQTLKVATQLVIGFALGVDGAIPYLREYNGKCQPPWSEKELLHKAQEAEKNKLGREPGAKIRDDEQKVGGKDHQDASHGTST
jgi:Bifunctional DNA primase/polymerase, N-terminal